MSRSYSVLSTIDNYIDRYEYLKLSGFVGEETFGYDRYLNQLLYNSQEWKKVRRSVILRDDGNDMGMYGYPIAGKTLIHHINPITLKDIEERSPVLFDLDNLISVSMNTHNAIHYGDSNLLNIDPVVRSKNDTCPWR